MSSSIREALEVLGVAADSDPATVAHAYRRLARATHPDVSPEPDAAQRFATVSAAYRMVADRARSGHRAAGDEGTEEPAQTAARAYPWGPGLARSMGRWGRGPVSRPTVDLAPVRVVPGTSPFAPARLRDGATIVAGPVTVQPSRPDPADGNPETGDA